MKKFVTLLLSVALMMSCSAVFAQESGIALISENPADNGRLNQPTTHEMQEMIKIVKPKLDVDQEASQFDWDYVAGSLNSPAQWSFSWSNEDNSLRVRVRCDNEGNITYYNFYDNRDNINQGRFPKYKKTDLEPKAKEFLKKIVPDIEKSLVPVETRSASIYSDRYTYRFVRYENDVIFPQNYVNVEINNKTGEMSLFNSNFNMDIEIDSKENIITEEEAKKILGTKLKMNLSYRVKTGNEYKRSGAEENNTVNAYLVYTPDLGYLSVDAKTGEIYTQNFSWDERDNAYADTFGAANGALKQESAMDKEAGKAEYRLNEKELEQLQVLAKLITKDEAIKIITGNAYLYLDPNLTAVEADLTRSTNYDYVTGRKAETDKYYWNIRFFNPRPEANKGYDYSYANATVDAQDGSLVSFNAGLKDSYYYENNKLKYPEVKYTLSECQNTAESFIKEQIPEKFALTRVNSKNPVNVIAYTQKDDVYTPVYGAYSYGYVRVNEGIDFNYNNIYAGVDGVSGKIYRYSYNWYDDVVFESPSEAIGENKAFEIYTSQEGFGLNYELFSEYIYNKYLENQGQTEGYIDYDKLYDTEYSSRLIYSVYDVPCSTIGALSGKFLDYNGEEFVLRIPYEYSDISGHWAEETIRLFSDVGVGFETDKFLPDEKITRQEFISIVEKAGMYIGVENEDENFDEFNRINAIECIIDAMGYKNIATLSDIYAVSYDDAEKIDKQHIGYAALAKGLGIARGSNNLLRPYDSLTRAEAVTLLRNALTCMN